MISEINQMQNEINQLYIEIFNKYSGGLKLSYPHVPRVTLNYLSNRVIVVGQETNTWYRKTEDDLHAIFASNPNSILKEGLENRYDRFIINVARQYGGNFWRFTRMLYSEGLLEESSDSPFWMTHVWINLFAVEACVNKKDDMGRPTYNRALAKNICELQKNLFVRQLRILQPKTVLFLTGPYNDDILKEYIFSTYDTTFIKADPILSTRMLCTIEITGDRNLKNFVDDMTIIRSYHPSYFMGRINADKKLKLAIKESFVEEKPTAYYTRQLLQLIRRALAQHRLPRTAAG